MQQIRRHYDPANWNGINRHLEENGYVLLGEHYCPSEEAFRAEIESWGVDLLDYDLEEPKPTSRLVYTEEEPPHTERCPPRQRFAYTDNAPQLLFIRCKKAATHGGEGILLDEVDFTDNAPKQHLNSFFNDGITYHRFFPYRGNIGITWPMYFKTNDPKVVEELITPLGIQHQWNDDDSLSLKHTLPSTRFHPVLRRDVWFAQPFHWHISQYSAEGSFLQQRYPVHQLPRHSTYGTKAEIRQHTVDTLLEWREHNSKRFTWKARDLLVIDNSRISLGRETIASQPEHWFFMGAFPKS